MVRQLVLLRHGLSEWNLANRFTGWHDVDLAPAGFDEAHAAGAALREAGVRIDMAYTSLLKRAIRTLWIVLDELDRMWVPVHRDWRLNERHYGALQGLDKEETRIRHGAEQVNLWRRGYAITPPPVDEEDPAFPGWDPRYAAVARERLPRTESLADTIERVRECWVDSIAPQVRAGRTPLLVAHNNSLRGLMKHLEGIGERDIESLDIPTGVPIVYELDDRLSPLRHYSLK